MNAQPKMIEGQLNPAERELLCHALCGGATKPVTVLEVGTWMGGGSTLHILQSLESNGTGHLWGIEADPSIYEKMIQNIQDAIPEAAGRFTPLFGFSQQIIPRWLGGLDPKTPVDFVFLDGGNNPMEQIDEFRLLSGRVPVGGQLMGHDAKLRKGKWLVPYLSALDNWKVEVHDISAEGLLHAVKVRGEPSPESLRNATRVLRKLRLDPVEIVGRLTPRPVCDFLLALLPSALRRRVGEGR